MYIKQISIHNFKSIEDAQIVFSPFTMIVGANAAGKSNIINVFRFIQSIVADGIDNAIALQGGIQYVANANMPKGERIEISYIIDLQNEEWMRHIQSSKYALRVRSIDYRFIIMPNKKGLGYHIDYDRVKIEYGCFAHDQSANKGERYTDLNIQYSTIFERKNQKSNAKVSYVISPEISDEALEKTLKHDNASSFFSFFVSEEKDELMMNRLGLLLPPVFSENTFIRVFDFDPRELKKTSSMASVRMLNEDGSNIASILQTILRNKEKSKKLTTLLKQFLPFVESLSVENNPDKSFSYKIRERYNGKPFYANFLSDGTVSILALILALYFEERSNIIILEEPERNIHPKLLASLISSAEDVSKEKQIIITTHNPEMLKHAEIANVRLVSRTTSGRTIVSAPEGSTVVQAFLKNDLGLDDLFLQGLLG